MKWELAPKPGDARLVTRLADGREVAVGKHRMHDLLGALLARLDGGGFDAIVLLCTGEFEGLNLKTRLVEAQLVVDETVMALSDAAPVGLEAWRLQFDLQPDANLVQLTDTRRRRKEPGSRRQILKRADPVAGSATRLGERAGERDDLCRHSQREQAANSEGCHLLHRFGPLSRLAFIRACHVSTGAVAVPIVI